MFRIAQISGLSGYKMFIRFTDGVEGVVDLSHLAGKGVFSIWQVPGCFESATVNPETGAITWKDGVDICPDALYMQITGKRLDEIFPNTLNPSTHA